jgi:hypothetical protein
MLADIRFAKVPASSARNPSLARSFLRCGMRAPIPPICMPTEPRFAKPQRAKVAIETIGAIECFSTSQAAYMRRTR